jgi:RNA polymerase sigma-70 factor (ECF subfamily)
VGFKSGGKVKETGFLKKLIGAITGAREEGAFSKTTAVPDEKLIELFTNENNGNAFEEIVNRYGNKVYGLAFRITRDHHGSEEVLQEVFLTLVKKIGTFRGESKFSSWLYRVTMNAIYMQLRSDKKHESDVSLEDYAPYNEGGMLSGVKAKDWSNRPDTALFNKEAKENIEMAVNKLPESYRVVFHLRDVEGLSNEETAEALGLSVTAVKSRLHRARLFLRDRLSDYFYERSK